MTRNSRQGPNPSIPLEVDSNEVSHHHAGSEQGGTSRSNRFLFPSCLNGKPGFRYASRLPHHQRGSSGRGVLAHPEVCDRIPVVHERVHGPVLPGSLSVYASAIAIEAVTRIDATEEIFMTTLSKRRLADVFLKTFPELKSAPTGYPLATRIDDQARNDVSQLFCTIQVRVGSPEAERFSLRLQHLPCNDHVRELVAEWEGEWESSDRGETLTLMFSLRDLAKVNQLARAIRSVVGRGARYQDSNWKWLAPRTADTLHRFVRQMKEAMRN